MDAIKYVKTIFEKPDMSDGAASNILWSCTGWPCFFAGSDKVKCLTQQLRHAKRSIKRGFTLDQIFMGDDIGRGRP